MIIFFDPDKDNTRDIETRKKENIGILPKRIKDISITKLLCLSDKDYEGIIRDFSFKDGSFFWGNHGLDIIEISVKWKK